MNPLIEFTLALIFLIVFALAVGYAFHRWNEKIEQIDEEDIEIRAFMVQLENDQIFREAQEKMIQAIIKRWDDGKNE